MGQPLQAVRALQVVRAAILAPRLAGGIDFWPDGVLVGDHRGLLLDAGPWSKVAPRYGLEASRTQVAEGLLLPPLLDAHIHVPQHPIRGRFAEGIGADPPEGRLLASLERNVFPAEGRCASMAHAREVIEAFLADTLAQGVLGGAAFMTVHASAARAALEILPDTWSVGLVLMNRHCPAYLRTDEASLAADVAALAEDFGRRLIVTDRFAVSVDSPLRRLGVELARRHDLRMQTHLNEQWAEKRLVEHTLHPEAAHYTDVYRRDGLLDRDPILAHCVRMRPEEFAMVADTSGAIAHCPVSNVLLGSGVMPLDEVRAAGVPFALCTDVGASPTTSLLCEMRQFLKVHAATSTAATAEEALWRSTLAPARILGLADRFGTFAPGQEYSYVEVRPAAALGPDASAGQAILHGLLGLRESEIAAWTTAADPRGRALDRLRRDGLDAGDDLAVLEADVRQDAAWAEGRVLRSVRAGRVVHAVASSPVALDPGP
jgi:guanine deaminase